jgi:hypothetical protein
MVSFVTVELDHETKLTELCDIGNVYNNEGRNCLVQSAGLPDWPCKSRLCSAQVQNEWISASVPVVVSCVDTRADTFALCH